MNEYFLTSCSNGSFLEPPPTVEAQVRFPAGTRQSWDEDDDDGKFTSEHHPWI